MPLPAPRCAFPSPRSSARRCARSYARPCAAPIRLYRCPRRAPFRQLYPRVRPCARSARHRSPYPVGKNSAPRARSRFLRARRCLKSPRTAVRAHPKGSRARARRHPGRPVRRRRRSPPKVRGVGARALRSSPRRRRAYSRRILRTPPFRRACEGRRSRPSRQAPRAAARVLCLPRGAYPPPKDPDPSYPVQTPCPSSIDAARPLPQIQFFLLYYISEKK